MLILKYIFQQDPNYRSLGASSNLEATTLSSDVGSSNLTNAANDIEIPDYVRPAFLGWLPLVAVIFYL